MLCCGEAAFREWDALGVVPALLDAQAGLDVQDRVEKTAMHYAVLVNLEAVVQVLVAAGAALDLRDIDGRTALDPHCGPCRIMQELQLVDRTSVTDVRTRAHVRSGLGECWRQRAPRQTIRTRWRGAWCGSASSRAPTPVSGAKHAASVEVSRIAAGGHSRHVPFCSLRKWVKVGHNCCASQCLLSSSCTLRPRFVLKEGQTCFQEEGTDH